MRHACGFVLRAKGELQGGVRDEAASALDGLSCGGEEMAIVVDIPNATDVETGRVGAVASLGRFVENFHPKREIFCELAWRSAPV